MIDFCLNSGFSVLTVFVSFLCAILASAFYKYCTNYQYISNDDDDANCTLIDHDNNDFDQTIPTIMATESSMASTLPLKATIEAINEDSIPSLSDTEAAMEEKMSKNTTDSEQSSNEILVDMIEGSEEEIQKQQIANIYRLLNDQHLTNNWTTNDFLDQLKMYGIQTCDEDELTLS